MLHFILLCSLLYGGEKSLTYLNGFSFTNTILYGDEAWDHLDQFSVHSGIILSQPLLIESKYRNRVRFLYTSPQWAQVRQLDGTNYRISSEEEGYGVNLFAGMEGSLLQGNSFFDLSFQFGPVLDYQSFADFYICNIGVESSVDWETGIGKRWSFVLEGGLFYYFYGVHNVGDYSRYNYSIKRGWGASFFPGLRYTY